MLQKSQDRHKISFAVEFNNKNIKKVFGANLPPHTIKLDLPPNTIRVNANNTSLAIWIYTAKYTFGKIGKFFT